MKDFQKIFSKNSISARYVFWDVIGGSVPGSVRTYREASQ